MTHKNRLHSKIIHSKITHNITYTLFGLCFIFSAAFIIWTASLKLPDFNNFEDRKIANSTKIYDRTGKVVIYNIHDNIKRTQIKSDEISDFIKKATISIEDWDFYNHYGIRPTSIIRSVLANIMSGSYSQGASTITQQVIKNALLSKEKTISRKIKEWILAIKLDAQVNKDDILTIYLNESPYGGTIYGVEEASLSYFGKHAKDINLTEAAYLAAMPQAPSRYSPFNSDGEALEKRKNLVLQRMNELGYISKEDLDKSQKEKITFQKQETSNGRAFHFVFYVRNYLEEKYGKDEVENGGLKVITTLDADLQRESEKLVYEGAMLNEKKFGAKNSAMVAIDPKNGQILSMVGSRDFFDTDIDGQYNVAISPRQPGSTFKPFVYLQGFMQGFTPDTVLYDVPTNFSTNCDAYGTSINGNPCYMPQNYDETFHGPVSVRHALLWSLNIPAVKMQYIVGVKNTIDFVKKFGINLGSASNYGLSLALGGGEVSLLDLTNAYAVFANNGNYNPTTAILEVRDKNDNVLEKYTSNEKNVVSKEYTDILNNILIDSNSRIPAYSANNPINYYDREVAVKTGTTNDFKDVWVIGYTPSIVIGMWGGNNDNAPVTRVAGTVLSPVWRKVMDYALKNIPVENFDIPNTVTDTPLYLKNNTCYGGSAHTILTYIRSVSDSQYNLWETPIQNWTTANGTCNLEGFEADPATISTNNTTQNSTTSQNVIIETTATPPNLE